jgi:hypothetical protein
MGEFVPDLQDVPVLETVRRPTQAAHSVEAGSGAL